MAGTTGERIVSLEARADGHDREFRDIKLALTRIEGKLDALQTSEDERRGALGLGRWIVGGSFLTLLGAAAAGVWTFVTGRPL